MRPKRLALGAARGGGDRAEEFLCGRMGRTTDGHGIESGSHFRMHVWTPAKDQGERPGPKSLGELESRGCHRTGDPTVGHRPGQIRFRKMQD